MATYPFIDVLTWVKKVAMSVSIISPFDNYAPVIFNDTFFDDGEDGAFSYPDEGWEVTILILDAAESPTFPYSDGDLWLWDDPQTGNLFIREDMSLPDASGGGAEAGQILEFQYTRTFKFAYDFVYDSPTVNETGNFWDVVPNVVATQIDSKTIQLDINVVATCTQTHGIVSGEMFIINMSHIFAPVS